MTRFGSDHRHDKPKLTPEQMAQLLEEANATIRYVVVENDPGYLPDSEPAEFLDLESAQDYLKQVRREWIEDHGYSPFEIRGSYKDGYYQHGPHGRVVEIMEVEK